MQVNTEYKDTSGTPVVQSTYCAFQVRYGDAHARRESGKTHSTRQRLTRKSWDKAMFRSEKNEMARISTSSPPSKQAILALRHHRGVLSKIRTKQWKDRLVWGLKQSLAVLETVGVDQIQDPSFP